MQIFFVFMYAYTRLVNVVHDYVYNILFEPKIFVYMGF